MATQRGRLSLRASKRTLERLGQRADLMGQKRTTLAERYLEEGLKIDEHPDLIFGEGGGGW